MAVDIKIHALSTKNPKKNEIGWAYQIYIDSILLQENKGYKHTSHTDLGTIEALRKSIKEVKDWIESYDEVHKYFNEEYKITVLSNISGLFGPRREDEEIRINKGKLRNEITNLDITWLSSDNSDKKIIYELTQSCLTSINIKQ